jgi:NADH:ubiquinone oxidoreductase subunit
MGLSSKSRSFSPHVPLQGEPSLSGNLNPSQWLPLAFFDSYAEAHSTWSISSFHLWTTQSRPQIHTSSGTVYGGPRGVRCLLFTLSRMAQCLDRLQLKTNVPRDILRVTSSPDRGWLHRHTSHTLAACTDVLRWQIAQSCAILSSTFNDHPKCWQDEVAKRYLQMSRDHVKQRDRNLINVIDTGVRATSGVPPDWRTIQEMYEEIKAQEKSQESDAEAKEVSVVVRHHIRPVLTRSRTRSRRRVSMPTSGDGEYICLGNISSQESEPSGEPDESLLFHR